MQWNLGSGTVLRCSSVAAAFHLKCSVYLVFKDVRISWVFTEVIRHSVDDMCKAGILAVCCGWILIMCVLSDMCLIACWLGGAICGDSGTVAQSIHWISIQSWASNRNLLYWKVTLGGAIGEHPIKELLMSWPQGIYLSLHVTVFRYLHSSFVLKLQPQTGCSPDKGVHCVIFTVIRCNCAVRARHIRLQHSIAVIRTL